jgi:hypothetical protein
MTRARTRLQRPSLSGTGPPNPAPPDDRTAAGVSEQAPGEEALPAARRRFSIAGLSPALLYLRPTPAALALASAMVGGLQEGGAPEGPLLDGATLAPLHDGPGAEAAGAVRLRVLPHGRFIPAAALAAAEGGPAAALRGGGGGGGGAGGERGGSSGGAVAVHVAPSEGGPVQRLELLHAILTASRGASARGPAAALAAPVVRASSGGSGGAGAAAAAKRWAGRALGLGQQARPAAPRIRT